MDNIEELKVVINKYGKDLIKDLAVEIINSNSKASGQMINDLSSEAYSAANQIVLEIYGSEYFRFVDEGRKSSVKLPPISKIAKWCTYRSISQTAAFPIAKKIARFGIPAKNIMNQFLKRNELKIEEKITEQYAQLVSKKLDEIIKS